jgi:excisionase family DNA binding protein
VDESGDRPGIPDALVISSTEAPSARAKALREEILGSSLNLDEVAFVLGLDRTTVAKYLRENVIVGFQIGREWLVPDEELRAYVRRLIEQRRGQPRGEPTAIDASEEAVERREGNCRICGKGLSAASRAFRGIGPICWNALVKVTGKAATGRAATSTTRTLFRCGLASAST